MTVRVQKWGNNLGVRIPKSIAQKSAIREGAELEVLYVEERVVLRPVQIPSLKQLLAGVRAANRPELTDWARPIGAEVW